jgi:hypothetical protein
MVQHSGVCAFSGDPSALLFVFSHSDPGKKIGRRFFIDPSEDFDFVDPIQLPDLVFDLFGIHDVLDGLRLLSRRTGRNCWISNYPSTELGTWQNFIGKSFNLPPSTVIALSNLPRRTNPKARNVLPYALHSAVVRCYYPRTRAKLLRKRPACNGNGN